MAGEALSSYQNRQRLIEEENNDEGDVVARSGTLFELDLLDCPICYHALTIPIFECNNGHIACSSCCTKMRNKCPSCALPIGNYRCRIMERVVEAVIVPCLNDTNGCTEKFSYGKELVHQKECIFVLCYCPAQNCNYSGVYNDLYSHYNANHKNTWNQFGSGYSIGLWFNIMREKILVLQQFNEGPLVVVQCFKEPQGMYFTVNCIAPFAPGVGEFSYKLSYWMISGDNNMTFTSPEMKRIQKVSFQTPEKDFMFVPNYFLGPMEMEMEICIDKLKKEADEEEDDNDDEEQDDEVEEEDNNEEEEE